MDPRPDLGSDGVLGPHTGMDAILWLLQNGANPDSIRWIMPKDAWLLNRASYQPGQEFFAAAATSIADQLEAIAEATTIDEVFERLEACGDIRRIDPSVKPEAYRGAIVSDIELEQLRRIKNIVRMGRVTSIESNEIVLDDGCGAPKPNPNLKRGPDAIFVPHRWRRGNLRAPQPLF